MRRFLSFFGLIVFGPFCLCALSAAGAVAAMPVNVLAPAKAEESLSAAQKAGLVAIAPHRAIYKMTLSSAKNSSNVSDISGRMLFEWRDVCDGWAVQQRMQLHFSFADGDDQELVSTELTWEAKDGKRYNFIIRRMTNGEETESYHGKALQNADGTLSVSYTIPEGKTEEVPAGTLFPLAHTKLILQEAALGEKFFSRRVFDGSDEDGSSDISAFIMPLRALAKDPSLNKSKTKKSPLLAGSAWPVHLAFFNIGRKPESRITKWI